MLARSSFVRSPLMRHCADDRRRPPNRQHPCRCVRPQPQRAVRRCVAAGHHRPPAVLDRPPGRGADTGALLPGDWRWRSATACSTAGRQPRRTSLDLGRKVTCYLSAEFLMGPQLGNNLLNLGIEDATRDGARSDSAWTSTTSWPARRSRGSATAASAGSPPAISTRWPPCSARRSATASDTSSASSTRRSRTAGRSRRPTTGWSNGNPWEIAKPDVSYLVNWGGHTEHYVDDAGRDRVRWVPARVIKGVSYDTPIQGYGVNTCNIADAVERAGREFVRAGRVQHRRLLQGRRGRGQLGDRHQGALSQRRTRCRQAASAVAAVLLRRPVRCRTSCTSMDDLRRRRGSALPRSFAFSSTTPTRRSASPN